MAAFSSSPPLRVPSSDRSPPSAPVHVERVPAQHSAATRDHPVTAETAVPPGPNSVLSACCVLAPLRTFRAWACPRMPQTSSSVQLRCQRGAAAGTASPHLCLSVCLCLSVSVCLSLSAPVCVCARVRVTPDCPANARGAAAAGITDSVCWHRRYETRRAPVRHQGTDRQTTNHSGRVQSGGHRSQGGASTYLPTHLSLTDTATRSR